MAFDLAKLKNIHVGDECNVFTYYSSDTRAVAGVTATLYFDTTAKDVLRVGDIIFLGSSASLTGISTIIVTGIAASGVSTNGRGC
jgi:hypothetical protein